jgi:hypothetical protein
MILEGIAIYLGNTRASSMGFREFSRKAKTGFLAILELE